MEHVDQNTVNVNKEPWDLFLERSEEIGHRKSMKGRGMKRDKGEGNQYIKTQKEIEILHLHLLTYMTSRDQR